MGAWPLGRSDPKRRRRRFSDRVLPPVLVPARAADAPRSLNAGLAPAPMTDLAGMETLGSRDPAAGRALVIEDDPDLRSLEVLALEGTGWVVSAAGLGADGLVLAKRDEPDVVVCDLRLPDTHGIDVITALAADPATASIPIVVLTAMTDSDTVVRAMEAGALEYLTKPFRASEFLAHCGAALRLSIERRSLAASEERHRTSLDALAEGIALYRVEGTRLVPTLINRASGEMMGMDVTQFAVALDAGMTHLIAEDGTPLEPSEIPPAITARTGRPVEGVIVGLRHDEGPVTWLRVKTVPLLDDRGMVTMVVTMATDVTEARSANSRLEMAAARFEAMVEHSSDLIIITGPDRCLRYTNPAFARFFGMDPCLYLGRPVQDLAHPDDRERLRRVFVDLEVEPGGVTEFECRFVRADATVIHALVTQSNHLDDPAVLGFVGNFRDITERVEATRSLAYEATHDSLTGLANRALFLDRLNRALTRSERSERPVVLLLLDLDDFKAVNDRFGHAAGDDLLIRVARRLKEVTREGDTVARLGGDEFVIITEAVDAAGKYVLVERIERALAGCYFPGYDSSGIRASVGIAVSDPGSTPDQLLASADLYMYKVKAGHRRDRLAHAAELTEGSGRVDP